MSEAHAKRLPGSWELQTYSVIIGGELKPSILGEQPTGLLSYTPDGYMSAIMTSHDRPNLGAPSLIAADNAAALAASRSCIAYAGRYEVIGDQVHHHVLNALLPDWVGQTLVRTISWQGDELTLAPPDEKTNSGKLIQRAISWRPAGKGAR